MLVCFSGKAIADLNICNRAHNSYGYFMFENSHIFASLSYSFWELLQCCSITVISKNQNKNRSNSVEELPAEIKFHIHYSSSASMFSAFQKTTYGLPLQ